MKEFIAGLIQPEHIKVLKKSHKKIYIEFYKDYQTLTPKCWGEIILNKNCEVSKYNLNEIQIQAKEMAISEWGSFEYRKHLFFGEINYAPRSGIGKRTPLHNSYFIYNQTLCEIQFLLWNDKAFKFTLDSKSNYNSGFIEYNSGDIYAYSTYKIQGNNNQSKQEDNVIDIPFKQLTPFDEFKRKRGIL